MTMIFACYARVSGLVEAIPQMNQKLIVFETACSTTGKAIATQPTPIDLLMCMHRGTCSTDIVCVCTHS